MTTLDIHATAEAYQANVLFGRRRVPTGPDDFGDADTVGLCLKRRGKSFGDLDIRTDFADYLGFVRGVGYVVGIVDTFRWYTGGKAYPTLEELKAEWVLD